MNDVCLIWFRVDLRTADHAALHHAAGLGKPLVGVYVISPEDWARHDVAACKVDFTLRTLAELSRDLAKINIPLLIRTARSHRDVPGVVAAVAKETGASAVVWNREYEVHEVARDAETSALLARAGVAVREFHDQTVVAPDAVRTRLAGRLRCFRRSSGRGWRILSGSRAVRRRRCLRRASRRGWC